MPIDTEVRDDAAGVIYHCYGVMTAKDFLDTNGKFLATPEAVRKWCYSIIDLTAVESMNLGYDDVTHIVELDKRLADLAPKGTLVAVCSSKDLGFGLARMWEALVEQLGWETQIFRTRAEADLCINLRAKQKFGLNPSVGPSPS